MKEPSWRGERNGPANPMGCIGMPWCVGAWPGHGMEGWGGWVVIRGAWWGGEGWPECPGAGRGEETRVRFVVV